MKPTLIILLLLAGCAVEMPRVQLTAHVEKAVTAASDTPTVTILRRGPDFIPDLNGDGVVNLQDWAFFTKHWLETGKKYQGFVNELLTRLIAAENHIREIDPNWFK